MSSTIIYPSTKSFPYVYRLDNPITGEFYVGYREANKLPSHLDLPEYKTSSNTIHKIGFEKFNYMIIAEFFDADDAYQFEQQLIEENFKNQLCLNKHYIKDGKNKFGGNAGVPKSIETRRKMSIAAIGVPRTEFERIQISKGRIGMKLSEQHKEAIRKGTLQRHKDHPVSTETRKKIGDNHRGKIVTENVGSFEYILSDPNDEIHNVFGMKKFCQERGFTPGTIWDLKEGQTVKKGLMKGWKLIKRQRRVFT